MDPLSCLVFDIGSSTVKVGYAGDDAPRSIFPTMLGRPKYRRGMPVTGDERSLRVGSEAQMKRGVLHLEHPVDRGLVTNWDSWQEIVMHASLTEMCVAPGEHSVLFSTPIMNPTHESEKMAQIWFETFQTPRLMGYLEPVLAVTSNGRTTALSVNLGGGLLQIVPIYEGHIISEAVIRKDFGGSDLTHYMAKMLMEDFRLERDFSSACIRDVEAIKDKRSYVAQDYELEMQGYTESSANFVEHVWEDGSKSLLSSQRIRCAEALFKPALLGLEHPGIHHLIYESILRCPVDIRSALYLNVGLNGGGTMIKGLAERLRRELDRLTPPNKGVKVYGAPERQFSAWTGGSIVASPNYMWWLLNWFTKEDYEEEGPWGIHRRGGLQWNIHDHLPSITR